MANTVTATFLEGRVTAANGNGFKLHNVADWLNLSKYAKPADVFVPRVGEHVRVKVDNSNFVRSVAGLPVAGGEAQPGAQEAQPEAAPEPRTEAIMSQVDAKDLRITRLACLNTSTAIIAGSTGRANPDEVIALAERLESWVLR